MHFPARPKSWLVALMSIIIPKQKGQVLRNLSFMQHPGSLLRHGKSKKAKVLPPSLLLPCQSGHHRFPAGLPSSLITCFPISTLAFLHHSLRATPHMAELSFQFSIKFLSLFCLKSLGDFPWFLGLKPKLFQGSKGFPKIESHLFLGLIESHPPHPLPTPSHIDKNTSLHTQFWEFTASPTHPLSVEIICAHL